MGCGKWKNWVMLQLGAEFTLGAAQLPINTGAAPDPGTNGKPRCGANIGWMALLLLLPLTERTGSPHHYHHPAPSSGNSAEIHQFALHSNETQACFSSQQLKTQ